MNKMERDLIVAIELECKIRISAILLNEKIIKFKIGKTIDSLDKRYNESDEYKNDYDEIKLIYETEDKALVDYLEKILIHDYMLMYPSKCYNEQEGAGPNCEDSDSPVARIYMVIKYKN